MVKRTLLGLAAALLLIQAIRPHPNVTAEPPGKDDFIVRFAPPASTAQTLRTACYDCHSNTTRYPWYAQVQPVGWWLADHINDGKRALNLSTFGAYDPKRQAKKIDAMSDQIANREMPLRSYLLIHHDARLTDEQIRALSAWLDDLHDKVAPAE